MKESKKIYPCGREAFWEEEIKGDKKKMSLEDMKEIFGINLEEMGCMIECPNCKNNFKIFTLDDFEEEANKR